VAWRPPHPVAVRGVCSPPSFDHSFPNASTSLPGRDTPSALPPEKGGEVNPKQTDALRLSHPISGPQFLCCKTRGLL
jgi:hypothetical protein